MITNSSEIGVVGEKAQNPTVIFVVEGNHGDMIYSSLVKQIAEQCISRDLKFLILSEFKDQDEKLATQAENLSNIPDSKTHEETTKFLNQNLIPMGNLFKRFTEIIPNALKALPDDVTPSMLLRELKENVDNPETFKLLNREIEIRKENEKNQTGEIGERDSPGKSGEDVKNFWGNGNAFVQSIVHKEMAQDVVKALEENKGTQILIIFSGTSHAYGVNQEVENLYPGFNDFQKLVVGRFQEEVGVRVEELEDVKSVQDAMLSSGKKSCGAVGEVVSFEVDPDTRQAILPSELLQKIKEKVPEKIKLMNFEDQVVNLKQEVETGKMLFRPHNQIHNRGNKNVFLNFSIRSFDRHKSRRILQSI